jgi:gliding motility-associated lipoprotein GldD
MTRFMSHVKLSALAGAARACLRLMAILPLLAGMAGCDEEEPVYSPKPRGYMRISFPEKKYRLYDSVCPYRFEIPVYARMQPDVHQGAEPCWMNLEFPAFRATVHLSYKPVKGNLDRYVEDSHDFANRHQIKATGVDETVVVRDSARVYGLLFDIEGNTASSLQFYITDSTSHFLRGALYFNSVPNADSMKVVVDFLRDDVLRLIRTAGWKQR